MRVTYNALVQTDVTRILKRYDKISSVLGDEFWRELNSQIEATAQNPGRGHPAGSGGPELRRVNLPNFPYHFLFRTLPGSIRITVVRHHQPRPRYGQRRR